MKEYMGKDFLLHTDTARKLFHDTAEDLPIIDYHCHIPPREIYENRRFDNLAQVWLGGHMKNADGSDAYFGDHYKWRLMRADGVSEDYITGDQPDYECFLRFARTLEKTIGNPMNHWCQLELRKYFGITTPLTSSTAKEIWDCANDHLRHDPSCTVRGLISQSHVDFIGTTDDPSDSLEWHQKIRDDHEISYTVAPSFRPDNAINIKPGFKAYMQKLSKVSGITITDADSCLQALEKRLVYFKSLGCVASDHGVEAVVCTEVDNRKASIAFTKAMADEPVSPEEKNDWESYLMLGLGRLYHKYGIVMQIHYNAIRNTNEKYYRMLGADTGFDAMDAHNCVHGIQQLLSRLTMDDACPRMILYSLNPNDLDMLAVMANSFQADSDVASRIQLGAAWWFNDTKDGIEKHLRTLARLGVLGDFVGMLTDSRSFLSYTRHEYFRRILCNLIGNWVEDGEFQNDPALLKNIVSGICYDNAKKFFSL